MICLRLLSFIFRKHSLAGSITVQSSLLNSKTSTNNRLAKRLSQTHQSNKKKSCEREWRNKPIKRKKRPKEAHRYKKPCKEWCFCQMAVFWLWIRTCTKKHWSNRLCSIFAKASNRKNSLRIKKKRKKSNRIKSFPIPAFPKTTAVNSLKQTKSL